MVCRYAERVFDSTSPSFRGSMLAAYLLRSPVSDLKLTLIDLFLALCHSLFHCPTCLVHENKEDKINQTSAKTMTANRTPGRRRFVESMHTHCWQLTRNYTKEKEELENAASGNESSPGKVASSGRRLPSRLKSFNTMYHPASRTAQRERSTLSLLVSVGAHLLFSVIVGTPTTWTFYCSHHAYR